MSIVYTPTNVNGNTEYNDDNILTNNQFDDVFANQSNNTITGTSESIIIGWMDFIDGIGEKSSDESSDESSKKIHDSSENSSELAASITHGSSENSSGLADFITHPTGGSENSSGLADFVNNNTNVRHGLSDF